MLTDLVLRPASDAFLEVGVFVALLVAPFGWARHRWGNHLDAALARRRRWAPLVAALLTVPPGCGGAIVVVALFARGAVSYGAVVAALVATTGDAGWVLLAGDPLLTLQLKALLVVTGAVTGWLVDATPLGRRCTAAGVPQPGTSRPASPAYADGLEPAARVLTAPRTSALHAVGALPALVWVALGTGALVSVPETFRLVDPGALGRTLLGAPDSGLWLGVGGALLCLVVFVRGGRRLADDDERTAHPRSLAEVLRHGCDEVAFITVWVAGAYVVWAVLEQGLGLDPAALPLAGLTGVAVGALLGLVPGCALQIVLAGVYLAGGMPLPTLVANTVSQDGDALLPLLAVAPRPAVLAGLLTTVPALVVGSALLLLT